MSKIYYYEIYKNRYYGESKIAIFKSDDKLNKDKIFNEFSNYGYGSEEIQVPVFDSYDDARFYVLKEVRTIQDEQEKQYSYEKKRKEKDEKDKYEELKKKYEK